MESGLKLILQVCLLSNLLVSLHIKLSPKVTLEFEILVG